MISSLSKDENEKQAKHVNTNLHITNKTLSDKASWNAFSKGDVEAINMIYQQNVDLMYNYGCQLLNEPELVKDCIQEVFIRLINQSSGSKPVVSVKAYLLKSLQREIFRVKQKNNKFKLIDSFEDSKSFAIALSDEIKPIDEQLNNQKRKLLKLAFDKLPKKQREALLLYYYEGFTYEEISYIMGVKLVKSTRKIVYKAIASIKSSISKSHIDLMFPILFIAFLELF